MSMRECRRSHATGVVLLALLQVAPAVRWCRYTWAEVPVECFAACVVAPEAATCGEGAGACAAAIDVSEPCCGAAEQAGGCPLTASDGDPAAAVQVALLSDFSRSSQAPAPAPTGRAWCPDTRAGARAASSPAMDDLAPAVAAADDLASLDAADRSSSPIRIMEERPPPSERRTPHEPRGPPNRA